MGSCDVCSIKYALVALQKSELTAGSGGGRLLVIREGRTQGESPYLPLFGKVTFETSSSAKGLECLYKP